MNFQARVLNCNNTSTEPCNKRKVLEVIAEEATKIQPELDVGNVMQILLQRERLGSTYVGNGIAIPHAKIEQLAQPFLILIHLKNPIPCDELNEEADLFFGLLIPEIELSEHLQLLDELINQLKQADYRTKIRQCKNSDELIELIEALPVCNSVSS